MVSGVFYVSTYEGVRHMLDTNGVKDLRIKALVGGSCASLGKWVFGTLVVQNNCIIVRNTLWEVYKWLLFQSARPSSSRST